MADPAALAKDILAFLDRHAKTAADYDPDYDAPEARFNGHDSAMLHDAAVALLEGGEFRLPNSDWGSGCYKPLGDEAAKA